MNATSQQHLLSVRDLTRSEVERLLERAEAMESALAKGDRLTTMQGKVMATLFFEPSTRTRLSFESAMLKLGGSVIGFADREQSRSGVNSSGEGLPDTARVVDGYADVIVLRHPAIGAAREFASYATKPVVNAGDGQGATAEHPTQALLDLYAMWRAIGHLDGIRVAVVGGLHQRVCHSLLIGLSLFNDVEVTLISPPADRLTDEEFRPLVDAGLRIAHVEAVEDAISEVDVIYHSGMSENPHEVVADRYCVTAAKLREAPAELLVLHPMPRYGEVPAEVDGTRHAGYFRQSAAGVPVRMAVLEALVA